MIPRQELAGEDLGVFNTRDKKNLRIAMSGKVTRTLISPVQSFEIVHDLGFIPVFLVYARVTNQSAMAQKPIEYALLPWRLSGIGAFSAMQASANERVIKISTNVELETTYYYYLFENKINDN